MKYRNLFPLDLSRLMAFPILCLGIIVFTDFLFSALLWFRHPTPSAWLLGFWVATSTSVLGAVLLLLAKLPQYRSGVFFQIGNESLPARERRLYRLAWLLILPSIIALLALYGTVHRFL